MSVQARQDLTQYNDTAMHQWAHLSNGTMLHRRTRPPKASSGAVLSTRAHETGASSARRAHGGGRHPSTSVDDGDPHAAEDWAAHGRRVR